MINKFINLIFLSFITLTTTQVNSQDNTFFRKYNLGGMQGGLQLAVTSDGGFIATGQHEGNGGNGDCDIYVYRVDLCGNIVWFKLIGTGSQEGGKSIKQTSDGGFIVSGLGPSNTSPRAFNMKLDSNGNIEWAKRYPSDWMLYSHEAINGDFINLAQNSLMRTDSVGNVLWRKYIGFMGSMNLWLDELSNGDIIVTSTGNGSDIYVGRFTSLGNTVWIKKYGAGYSSVDHVEWSSKGVVNSIENSVCVTSPTYLGSQGGENILVMKLNLTDGSLIWSKAVGGPASDQSRDIQLFPGGYAIAGNTASYPVAINPSAGIIQNFGERDALLFTMDENGNEIWSRTYGGDERDKAIGVQYNSDNGFTLSAYSSSSIFGNFDSSMDPLFIKTDSLGFVACQTNSPPLVFQDVSVSITPILTQPSDEGIDSYSFTANVIDFNPSDGYLCQQCISTPLFQVSDTAVCVGDTVSFFNTTIIGLTCFQQWYIDGQQYDGTINPFYSFDTAGDYQIQLMSTCGVNADTFNIVIHVYPIPTVDAGIDTIFCVNGILTLSAGGADTYIWSNGVINNVPFFPSSSGTFSVIGTTIYGCTNYDTLEIIINMRPEVLAQDTILCSDIACGVTLGDDIDGPTASTYNITAINSNGLSASAGTPLVANGVINSNLIDDAWTNTTNAPVGVIYTIVPISAIGCEGTPFTVTITVNPEPIMLDQVTTVCSDVACGLSLANDIDGPTASIYNITAINSNGLSSSAGTPLVANGVLNSNLIDDVWINTTNAPVDVIYTIVPISAIGCEGTPFTVTLTINPEPVVSDQVLTVCSDVASGLTLGDDIDGPTASSYNITTINSNGLSSSAGTPLVANGVINSNLIDDAWTNTTNAPVDVIYTIVPISSAACEGTPFTVTLTINPEPVVSNQVLTLCSDIASGLTLGDDIDGPTASTYNIISINSNGLSASAGTPLVANGVLNSNLLDDAWINTTNAPVDVIYTIVPISAAGCEGTPFTVTLTINPEPVVSNQVLTLCSDIASGLTLADDIDGPTASTYNITAINSNGLSSSAGTPLVANGVLNSNLFDDAWTNTTNAPVDVIYTIVPISAIGCEGTPFTVTLTINPDPFISDQVLTLCSDIATSLTLGDDIDGPTASYYNITTINSNGLSSSAGTPLVANGVLNSNLIDDTWTNTTNAPLDVIYTIVPISAAGCEGTPFTVTLTINPEPVVSNQVLTLCSDIASGLTLADDIDGPTASTYNITAINSNGLSSSAGTPLVANGVLNSNLFDDAWTNTTNAPVDVIYTIVPISAIGCEGTPFTVTLTINPDPFISDQVLTLCSDIASGLTLGDDIDGPTASSYNITSINSNGLSSSSGLPLVANGVSNSNLIDDAWTNTTNAPLDVIYTIVPISAVACEGTPFTVTLTINPESVVSDQVLTVCSDVACGLTLANDIDGPTASIYNITAINSNGLSSSAGTPLVVNGVLNSNLIDDVWTNTTNAPVDVIYTIVPISAIGCEGTPFTVTLTINPEPVVSDQVLTVCSDVACGLTLANDINGPTASYYNITTINSNGLSSSAGTPLVANGVLNSNLIDDTWTNTTNAPVDVIYTIVPISAVACEGTPFTVTLTINPEPVVSNQTITICSDILCGLTLADDINGPTASSYNITTINSNGLSSSAGNPLVANGVSNSNLIDDAWTNTTNAPVDVIYTIVPLSTVGCEGTPFTVILTINPEPLVPNQVGTVCSEDLIGVTLANDPNGPNLQSWNITNISIGSSLVPNSANVNVGTTISNQYIAGDIYVNNSILDIDVIYSLIPKAINGCIGNPFTITITVYPLPVFNVFDAVVCADHYVTLTGNPSSYSYNWDHGVSNNVPFIPPYTDTYNVVATNTITGCIQYSSALVTVHPNPIADFIQSWDELMAIYTNTSTGAVNYYWNMGDGGIIITSKNVSYTYQIIDSLSYIVTLIAETEFGCLDTISRVITTPLVFYVPNSFTPDGNEYNNEFTPVFSSKRKVKNYSLSIYNRWGGIVFETKDIDFGWDGTYKNKAAQIGTYTWQLQFTNLFNSKKELINGHVNLLR